MPDPDPRYGKSTLTLNPKKPGGFRLPDTRMTPGDRGLRADAPYNQPDAPRSTGGGPDLTEDPSFWAFLMDLLGGRMGVAGQNIGDTLGGRSTAPGRSADGGGYGPVPAGGPYPPMTGATMAGYLDPSAVRDPKTGLPTSYRPGTPDSAKAGYKATTKETVPVGGKTATGPASAGTAAGTAVATKGGAPAPATAPVAPSATGWEEEFYRTHGRFPGEWDYADKLWSESFARQSGRAPTREDWVSHAKENLYNPERPATPEFAPGWGLDVGFGPKRPAPMSAVPTEVQVPGLEKGKRWEKPTGAPRGGTPAATEAAAPAEPKAEGMWGQLIPESWDTQTTNQAFGQWLAEGGSGEPDDWAAHLQAVGAG